MDIINHSINWCKGEIFEGKMSLLFGAIILVVSLVYWKFGSTDAAKAIFIPLLTVAIFTLGTGYYLVSTNTKRILQFQEQYDENPSHFIKAEKERTEAFLKWYPYTQYIMIGIMIAGMLCMILTHKPIVRAIGIALMLTAFYTFVLDHFSEERANEYHNKIVEQVDQ